MLHIVHVYEWILTSIFTSLFYFIDFFPCVKIQLAKMLEQYQDVFSKHHLDCLESKGFVHKIRLTDDHPFCLPYCRVPPAHDQKLHQVFTEMEEQGIILKSVSKYASTHDHQRCPSPPSSVRLFGSPWQKYCLQHHGPHVRFLHPAHAWGR